MNPESSDTLRKCGIMLRQDANHPLFLFSLTSHELLQIADVSRVSRDDEGSLIGYQRPEVKKHIKNIVDYLDSETVVFPNPIILALNSKIVFEQTKGINDDLIVPGILKIPIPENGQAKPAWIVDGQQRTMALASCNRKAFPIPISGFVADDIELQRDQFLRINSTQPLPKGLIDELLPEINTPLPSNLSNRKLPSILCDMLNQDPESPFYRLIRRASSISQKRNNEVVTDTVVTYMLQESLNSPYGALFPFHNIATGITDLVSIRKVLFIYWGAVREVFPESWGVAPQKSRLMHCAGIKAMGKLMNRVMASVNINNPESYSLVKNEINRIKPICRWNSGVWEGLGNMGWNDIKGIPDHIQKISDLIVWSYVNSRETTR